MNQVFILLPCLAVSLAYRMRSLHHRSFTGTQRFVNNVSNLGGLMEDIKLNITGIQSNYHNSNTRGLFPLGLDTDI